TSPVSTSWTTAGMSPSASNWSPARLTAGSAVRSRPGLLQADWHATGGEVPLRIPDGVLAEVEDGGGQGRVGPAWRGALGEMFERPHAAGGDHGHRHRRRDRAGQLEIVAVPGPVAVHAGQEDLARPELLRLARPADDLAAGGPPTPVAPDAEP